MAISPEIVVNCADLTSVASDNDKDIATELLSIARHEEQSSLSIAGKVESRQDENVKKQVLFIQGGGTGAHDEWDNKLVDSLRRELGPAYDVRYPRMPKEADPSYTIWKAALAEEIAGLDDGAILIGHSVGGTILINALAETPPNRKLAGIFLIAAPFVGPGGWPSEDITPTANLGARLPPKTPIYLYHGSKDDTAPFAHVDLYERAIPSAIVHRLLGRNHQLNDDLAEVAAGVRVLT